MADTDTPNESSLMTTTGIDSLVEYLKTHGETDESVLATQLKVSVQVIEGWASVLEKASIAKIVYKLGKMYVSPMAQTSPEAATIASALDIRKQQTESELVDQGKLLEEVDKRLNDLNETFKSIDKVFKKDSGTLKKDLDELTIIERDIDRHFSSLRNKKEHIDNMAKSLDKEIGSLQEMSQKIYSFNLGTEDANKLIDDIKRKINAISSIANEVEGSFEREVSEKRKQISQLKASINEEVKVLNDALDQQHVQIDEAKRLERLAKLNADNIKIYITKERALLINDLETAKLLVDREYPLAEERFNKLENTIKEVRKSFGELGSFDEQLKGMKERLREIMKEKQELASQIIIMKAQLKAISDMPKSQIEKKKLELNELGKGVAKASNLISELSTKTADVKKDAQALAEGKKK